MKIAAKSKSHKRARRASKSNNFDAVFRSLKAILEPYRDRMVVKTDTPRCYYMESASAKYKGKTVCFGAARRGKNYVSYYLMGVYMCPDLVKSISPELKKRMQGKSCFSFTAIDPSLFHELAKLTEPALRDSQMSSIAKQFSKNPRQISGNDPSASADVPSGHIPTGKSPTVFLCEAR